MSTKNWMVRSFWCLLAVLISTLALSNSFGSVKATSSRTLLQAGDPPTSITITAPSVGTINQSYTFTASVSPGTAATPITYTWHVTKDDGTEEEPIIHEEVPTLTDSLSYTWASGGFKYIWLTAANASGSINKEFFFPVEVPAFLYPPYRTSIPYIHSVFDHDLPWYDTDPHHNSVLTWKGELYSGTWIDGEFNGLQYPGHPGFDYTFGYLPIHASASSDRVVYAGWDEPTDHRLFLGLYVDLHHTNGYHTLYGHLSSISVKSCTQSYCPDVKQGDFIGISGDTGASTGPHLHFEVRTPFNYNNTAQSIPVDPYGYDPIDTSTYQEPEWKFTQPNMLWVDLPPISGQPQYLGDNSKFPSGSKVLPLLDSPTGGVVVDDYGYLTTNNAPNFTTTGTGTGTDCWHIEPKLGGYAGYAENNYNLSTDAVAGTDENDKGTCWAKWYLPLGQPTGEYSIYVRIPQDDQITYADNALYRVYRSGNEVAKINVSQFSINNTVLRGDMYSQDPTVDAGWIYIGNYYFAQGTGNYVELTDKVVGDTINVADSTVIQNPKIAVDAVKFVRAASSKNVDTVLIIDSSGSMGWNDPTNIRLQAARTFVTKAAVQDDYVGVVDFDSTVRVATNPPLQKLHDNDASVVAAINTIDSSGGTNIGVGIQKGCDLLNLSDRLDYRRARYC